MTVSAEAVERAANDLRPYLPQTPLQFSRAFSDQARAQVHLKIETVQPIRAFKVRGALNRVMHIPVAERGAGVITASAGNDGLGVAYAAATFDTPATVYVPEGANALKVEAIRRLGATVIAAGHNYNEANLEALAAQTKTGATFVHAYDDPHVVTGQGTVGLEILAGLEDVNTVFVPVGGGGLIGGIALFIKTRKPAVRVVGVEPAGADAMSRSVAAGHIVTLDRVNTIADGLAASAPSALTYDLARRYVDEILTVQEEEMLRAIRVVFQWEHLLAEPAGAAALAALLYHHRAGPNEKAAVVLSGANIGEEVLLRALKTR